MSNKAKKSLKRLRDMQSKLQNPKRPGRVKNLGTSFEEHWENECTVVLVELRRCRCGAEYPSPAPTLMMRQRHIKYKQSSRLTKLSSKIVHPDPLLPQRIEYLKVELVRCPTCFQARDEQQELFPTQRFLGVQGMRPPKPKEASATAPATPKVKPIPDDFF